MFKQLFKALSVVSLLTSSSVSYAKDGIEAATNSTSTDDISLKSILSSESEFNENIIKQILVRHDMNHLLLSDANKLMAKIAKEFPDYVKLSTIGTSLQGRPMVMMTIDAPVDGY